MNVPSSATEVCVECKSVPETARPSAEIVSSSAWLERIDAARKECDRTGKAHDEAKDILRELERMKSDAAPGECEVCGRGIWPWEEPHKHFNTLKRSRPPFIAKVVVRSNAQAQRTGAEGDAP